MIKSLNEPDTPTDDGVPSPEPKAEQKPAPKAKDDDDDKPIGKRHK